MIDDCSKHNKKTSTKVWERRSKPTEATRNKRQCLGRGGMRRELVLFFRCFSFLFLFTWLLSPVCVFIFSLFLWGRKIDTIFFTKVRSTVELQQRGGGGQARDACVCCDGQEKKEMAQKRYKKKKTRRRTWKELGTEEDPPVPQRILKSAKICEMHVHNTPPPNLHLSLVCHRRTLLAWRFAKVFFSSSYI